MAASAARARACIAEAGASPAENGAWAQINWERVTEEVTRLQARIAKATQVGRWNKVQALQRLLIRSRSGKLLAVKRVTENEGKRTAGVDRQIWQTPTSKMKASQALTHRGYQRYRCDACTSRRAMERRARWAFRPCATGLCRRCGCWR